MVRLYYLKLEYYAYYYTPYLGTNSIGHPPFKKGDDSGSSFEPNALKARYGHTVSNGFLTSNLFLKKNQKKIDTTTQKNQKKIEMIIEKNEKKKIAFNEKIAARKFIHVTDATSSTKDSLPCRLKVTVSDSKDNRESTHLSYSDIVKGLRSPIINPISHEVFKSTIGTSFRIII